MKPQNKALSAKKEIADVNRDNVKEFEVMREQALAMREEAKLMFNQAKVMREGAKVMRKRV
ncbi:hypothetical protein ACX27_18080 [Nostoc piscinale CENA21]|uniref:Uncharacterized protein n=1 Tax=Nostoc piscinale CENA21 TaxID=224013 RepID=A0A0M3V5V2_9NOSO|nr:hypothetical protein [Nostoc piscinale]ALF54317.1 hypothetical protein ACX27_18080 [Nostoc piscinale CENA21]